MLSNMSKKPRAVFLDFATVGPGVDMSALENLVDVSYHDWTPPGCEAERVEDSEVIIVNKARIDAATIGRARRAKLIVIVATGTDNVDTRAAQAAGIAVANIREYCNSAVVQHVFALVLTLTQHVHEYDALVRDGTWTRSRTFALFDYPIRELGGRNLGVVGYGSLGRSVADFGRCLGMNVLVSARPGTPRGEVPADRVPFEDVVRDADVLTLHCPLTDDTRHMLSTAEFARMRSDAILINTARGGLVDSVALVHALETGEIAGAGLDVLTVEPPSPDDPLLARPVPNLLLTPHIAWAALEARQRGMEQVVENISAFLAGDALRRVV
jgi:glycerate dehydrogenase